MGYLQTIKHSSPLLQTLASDFLQQGTLSVVAGRRLMGTLSSLSRLAIHSATENKQTAFLTVDSTQEQVEQQLESFIAKDELKYFSLTLYNYDVENEKIDNIIRYIEENKYIDVLFIDELYAIRKNDNGFTKTKEEIHNMIETLHNLAKDYNIAIVVGATLSRRLESRENKRPILSDFGFDDATYDLFDNILTLYRDEVYHPDTTTPNVLEKTFLKSKLHGNHPLSFVEHYRA